MTNPNGTNAAISRVELEELTASEPFLDLLLSSIPSPIIVVDAERKIVLANSAFVRATGTPGRNLVGRSTAQIFRCPGSKKPCDPSGDTLGCAVCSSTQLALRSEQPVRTLARFDTEEDGHIVPSDGFLSVQAFRFRNQLLALVVFPEHALMSAARPPALPEEGMNGIVGRHGVMLQLYEAIRRVGPSSLPVLIQGESGTGKELIATAVHRESRRCGRPLVTVNSGALPEGVLESELFGHVRGAFTGAIRDKRGRFEMANNATLFLDEVGELPPQMQVKLLRVLQEGTFERVGGEQTVKVDVRLICATNRDLAADVANGRFRADLYYRISAVPITAPSLRSHKSDIPLLVQRILYHYAEESQSALPEVSAETMDILLRYDWPGNVRELENALHFGIVYASGGVLLPRHLPPRIVTEVAACPRAVKLDAERIRTAIEAAEGNKRRAAQMLGVSRATLYRCLGATDEQHSGHGAATVSVSHHRRC